MPQHFLSYMFRRPTKVLNVPSAASLKPWLIPAVHSTLTLWHLCLHSASQRRFSPSQVASISKTLAFTR